LVASGAALSALNRLFWSLWPAQLDLAGGWRPTACTITLPPPAGIIRLLPLLEQDSDVGGRADRGVLNDLHRRGAHETRLASWLIAPATLTVTLRKCQLSAPLP
jgi:hypothetical protein